MNAPSKAPIAGQANLSSDAPVADMPSNLAAEQAVIGAILMDNACFAQIDGIVEADHFYDPTHKLLFESCAKACRAGELVNHVTLLNMFRSIPGLEDVDSKSYLVNLAERAGTILDVVEYARLVRDLSCRRSVVMIAEEAKSRALDMASGHVRDWSEIVGDVRTKLDGVTAGLADDGVMTGPQVIERLLDKLDKGVKVMPTGIAKLDKSFGGGLRPGCLYAIEAPAKFFKTGVATGVFDGVVKSGKRAMFITLELAPEDILQRLVGGHAGVSFNKLEDARFKDENMKRVFAYQNTMKGYDNALYRHEPGATANEIMAYCARAVTEHRVDVIVIDYWQRIRGMDEKKSEAANLEQIANQVADFAARHGPAVVMASQLNRQDESLGSDGLRRACSWRGKLHKVEMPSNDPDHYLTGLWVEVADNRYGPGGHIGEEDYPAFRIAVGPVLRDWEDV